MNSITSTTYISKEVMDEFMKYCLYHHPILSNMNFINDMSKTKEQNDLELFLYFVNYITSKNEQIKREAKCNESHDRHQEKYEWNRYGYRKCDNCRKQYRI
jgi:hypothetical protein